MQCICSGKYLPVHCLHFIIVLASTLKIFCNYTYPLITAYVFHVSLLGSDRKSGSVRVSAGFGRFGKNSWFGRFLVCVRKRPKFWFGSGLGKKNRRFGSVRFGFGRNSWFGRFLIFTCTLYIGYILHLCLPAHCLHFTRMFTCTMYIVYILHLC